MVVLYLLGCFAPHNAAATAEYARQVTTANLRVAQLEQQLVHAETRIEQLEEFVRAQGRSQATKMENLDQVNAEVTRLRGLLEVLQYEVEQLRQNGASQQVEQERRQLHDERRLAKLEAFLGVQPPPPPTDEELGLTTEQPEAEGEPAEQEGEPPDTTEVPPTAAGKLALAKEHMEAGRQRVARAILQRALEAHPDAPERDEIAYRLAETYFEEKAYSKAALAFKRVLDDAPRSPWASWAMLRQGDCFQGLGQADNARLFYDGVIQRFPRSDAAKEAEARLRR